MAEAPAEAAEEESQVIPGRSSSSFLSYCHFDSRMKTTGINYVTIEVGLVPMDVDINLVWYYSLHATLITFIYVSTCA